MKKQKSLNIIDEIHIGTPCPKDWHEMQGDERRRYCQHCSLHVTNLSAHTRKEAFRVLRQAGDKRLCVRVLVGSDGKVLYRPSFPWWTQSMRTASRCILTLLALMGISTTATNADSSATQAAPEQTERPLMGERMGDYVAGRSPSPSTSPTPSETPRATLGIIAAPQELMGKIVARPEPQAPKEKCEDKEGK